jgi:DNA-binding response OmpR family regulator
MIRILVVDDEPMIREELQESLEFEGFEVTAAASVESALSAFEERPFPVVVTDLKMPKMGGLELIKKLRETKCKPTTFVVSGHGAESNRTEAIALGAADCFPKPLDIDALISAINDRLGNR